MTLLWIGLVACDDPTSPEDSATEDTGDTSEQIGDSDDSGETAETGDTDEDDTAEDAEEEARYQAFYAVDSLQRVDITLSEDAITALTEDPQAWVSGTFAHDNVEVTEVGVRLRGSQDLTGKPSFKLKLNELVPGQRYATLERIALNNMADDPTQSKEILAFAVWAAAGLVAPRANYAEVYVNGESYGLYANVEAVDDHFLERRYTDDAGDLWEANDSADFTAEGLDNFQLVSGEGSTARLGLTFQAVWAADFWTSAGQYIDVPQFLDFWAWTIVIGNQDGYPYTNEDYYLYGDPEDDLYEYTPWALDETWDDELDPLVVTGAVALNCLQDSVCSTALDSAVDEALTSYEAQDHAVTAAALHTLTETAVLDDDRRAWTTGEVVSARAALLNHLDAWPATVRTEMGL